MQAVSLILANWTLKAVMAYLAYLFSNWLNLPEWGMVAIVATATVDSRIVYKQQTKAR